MNDRNLARGLFLIAISLLFGLQAVRYPIGTFSRAGAGLFPLMVSSLLLLIGVITLVRSRFETHVPITFNPKNIAIILASLCGFAVISAHVNMIAGIEHAPRLVVRHSDHDRTRHRVALFQPPHHKNARLWRVEIEPIAFTFGGMQVDALTVPAPLCLVANRKFDRANGRHV